MKRCYGRKRSKTGLCLNVISTVFIIWICGRSWGQEYGTFFRRFAVFDPFFPELSVSDVLLIFDLWWFVQASNLFELHLYTMGNKLYATEMAKVLDPTGTLFAGRVISRGDDGDPFDSDERVPKSKDLDGVLGMESAVVIIDDSVRVWPHNRHNLIVVERYASVLSFFLMKCCQMHLPNPLSMWFSADTPISPAAGVNLAFLDHHF
jgi:hypothetical protein